MAAQYITGTCFENSVCTLLARMTGANGGLMTSSTVSALSYKVTDLTTYPTSVVVPTTTLSPISSYIFDTLQTDASWTKDQTGYSFKLQINFGTFANANHLYEISVYVTPVAGANQEFPIVFRVTALQNFGP